MPEVVLKLSLKLYGKVTVLLGISLTAITDRIAKLTFYYSEKKRFQVN